MEKRHREILRKARAKFVSDLKVADILHRFSEPIFTELDEEEIKVVRIRHQQTETFLDILPRRGPIAYYAFKEALRSPYPHLFDVLEDEEEFYRERRSTEKTMRDLRPELQEKTEENKKLFEERKELKRQLEQMERIKKEFDGERRSTAKTMRDLRPELQEKTEEHIKLFEERKELRSQLEQMERIKKEFDRKRISTAETIRDLQAKLQEKTKENIKITEDLNQERENSARLALECQDLKAKLVKEKEESKKIVDERDELRKQLEEKGKTRKTTEDLNQERENSARLALECQDLKAKLVKEKEESKKIVDERDELRKQLEEKGKTRKTTEDENKRRKTRAQGEKLQAIRKILDDDGNELPETRRMDEQQGIAAGEIALPDNANNQQQISPLGQVLHEACSRTAELDNENKVSNARVEERFEKVIQNIESMKSRIDKHCQNHKFEADSERPQKKETKTNQTPTRLPKTSEEIIRESWILENGIFVPFDDNYSNSDVIKYLQMDASAKPCSTANPCFQIDLGEEYRLIVTHYTFEQQNNGSSDSSLRLEGSNDGRSWTTLNSTVMGNLKEMRRLKATWRVQGIMPGYRYFRAIQRGSTAAGIYLSRFWLYGVLLQRSLPDKCPRK